MRSTALAIVACAPDQVFSALSLKRLQAFYMLVAAVALLVGPLWAIGALPMGTEERGNKPLNELNYTKWTGIMPLVNDKARVYQVWVNGNENLYYKGTTEQCNQALTAFAKVDVKNHVVVFRPAPVEQRAFDKTPIGYNWELHVINGIALSRATDDIEDLEWQRDPVLTVFVGGGIELKRIEIPKGLTLRAAPGKSDEAKRNEELNKSIQQFVNQRTTESKK